MWRQTRHGLLWIARPACDFDRTLDGCDLDVFVFALKGAVDRARSPLLLRAFLTPIRMARSGASNLVIMDMILARPGMLPNPNSPGVQKPFPFGDTVVPERSKLGYAQTVRGATRKTVQQTPAVGLHCSPLTTKPGLPISRPAGSYQSHPVPATREHTSCRIL